MRRDLRHTAVLSLTVALLSVLVPAARGEDVEKGRLWIGVSCAPVDNALRAQLKLPEKAGVVVKAVHDDSPAQAEGLQPFDILLTANDKPLNQSEDLMAAIKESGEKEIKFTLLRAGERKEVTVRPKPLPNRKLQDDPGVSKPVFLNLVRPGQLVPLGDSFNISLPDPELPENMTVTITKHGKDKTKLKIEADGKTWEATEDKLDELPAEVRKRVEPMTRRFMLGVTRPIPPQDLLLFTPDPSRAKIPPNPGIPAAAIDQYRQAIEQARAAQRAAHEKLRQLEERYRPSQILEEQVAPRVEGAVEQARQWSLEKLDSRFDQVQRQLDELRRAVKAMRNERKGHPGPTPSAPAEPVPPLPPEAPAGPAPPAPVTPSVSAPPQA